MLVRFLAQLLSNGLALFVKQVYFSIELMVYQT